MPMDTLAHVTAPSSRKDDDRYRRQVLAYLAFQPTNRIPLDDREHPLTQHVHKPLPDAVDEPRMIERTAAMMTRLSPSMFLDDTQLAISALESQLITSSIRQLPVSAYDMLEHSLPELPHPPIHAHAYDFEHAPEFSLLSNGFDSTPMANIRKRRRSLSESHASSKRPQSLASPFMVMRESQHLAIGYVGTAQQDVNPIDEELDDAPISNEEPASSSKGDDIPSQLPSTYSLSNVTSTPKGQTSHPDNVPSSPAPAIGSTPTRGPRESSFRGRPALSISPKPVVPTALPLVRPGGVSFLPTFIGEQAVVGSQWKSRATESEKAVHVIQTTVPKTPAAALGLHTRDDDVLSSTRVPDTVAPSTTFIIADIDVSTPTLDGISRLNKLSLIIKPVMPPTSLDCFTTHVTSDLRTLADMPDIACRYDPAQLARNILPSERGHWLLDTTDWTYTLQFNFWTFMKSFIGSGKAGWNVWCLRAIEEDTGGQALSARLSKGLGKVQVFCWGEVVRHVYLLLYVASRSKVRLASPIWIDAGGEIVVQFQ